MASSRIHIGTFRETCESMGCPGCPPIEGIEATEALKAIGRFVQENFSTIDNALGNQYNRMQEAGEDPEIRADYRKVFAEDAAKAKTVLTALTALVETLSEAQQEEFANQA